MTKCEEGYISQAVLFFVLVLLLRREELIHFKMRSEDVARKGGQGPVMGQCNPSLLGQRSSRWVHN